MRFLLLLLLALPALAQAPQVYVQITLEDLKLLELRFNDMAEQRDRALARAQTLGCV